MMEKFSSTMTRRVLSLVLALVMICSCTVFTVQPAHASAALPFTVTSDEAGAEAYTLEDTGRLVETANYMDVPLYKCVLPAGTESVWFQMPGSPDLEDKDGYVVNYDPNGDSLEVCKVYTADIQGNPTVGEANLWTLVYPFDVAISKSPKYAVYFEMAEQEEPEAPAFPFSISSDEAGEAAFELVDMEELVETANYMDVPLYKVVLPAETEFVWFHLFEEGMGLEDKDGYEKLYHDQDGTMKSSYKAWLTDLSGNLLIGRENLWTVTCPWDTALGKSPKYAVYFEMEEKEEPEAPAFPFAISKDEAGEAAFELVDMEELVETANYMDVPLYKVVLPAETEFVWFHLFEEGMGLEDKDGYEKLYHDQDGTMKSSYKAWLTDLSGNLLIGRENLWTVTCPWDTALNKSPKYAVYFEMEQPEPVEKTNVVFQKDDGTEIAVDDTNTLTVSLVEHGKVVNKDFTDMEGMVNHWVGQVDGKDALVPDDLYARKAWVVQAGETDITMQGMDADWNNYSETFHLHVLPSGITEIKAEMDGQEILDGESIAWNHAAHKDGEYVPVYLYGKIGGEWVKLPKTSYNLSGDFWADPKGVYAQSDEWRNSLCPNRNINTDAQLHISMNEPNGASMDFTLLIDAPAIDKSALIAAIEAGDAIMADKDIYDAGMIAKLEKALATGKYVAGDPTAAQVEIDPATEKIMEAIDGVKSIPVLYFRQADGSVVLPDENNVFTLNSLMVGKFSVSNASGFNWNCVEFIENEPVDIPGAKPVSYWNFWISEDGTYQPHGAKEMPADVTYWHNEEEINEPFTVVTEKTGITEIKAYVNGEEMTADKTLEVAGREWIHVDVMGLLDGEWIPLPKQAFEIAPQYNIHVYEDNVRLWQTNHDFLLEVHMREDVTVKTEFTANACVVHITGFTIEAKEEWELDKLFFADGRYVGVAWADDPDRGYVLNVEPANTTELDFEWVSSDPSVAEFEVLHSAGIVPKKAGSVHFTVTNKANPDLKQELDFTFTYKTPLESVTAQPAHYDMMVGDLDFAKLQLNPENATQKQFVWTYDTDGIVSVENKIQIDENGNAIVTYPITALRPGEVTVTGTPVDDTANCIPVRFTVNVKPSEEQPVLQFRMENGDVLYPDGNNVFTLNPLMVGKFEMQNGTDVDWDCVEFIENEPVDIPGAKPVSYWNFWIAEDGSYQPHGAKRMDAKVTYTFDGEQHVQEFVVDTQPSGITEIKAYVKGEEMTADKVLEVAGSEWVHVDVKGLLNGEWIDVPMQAFEITPQYNIHVYESSFRLWQTNHDFRIEVQMRDNEEVKTEFTANACVVHITGFTIEAKEDWELDKLFFADGRYVGVARADDPNRGYVLKVEPANATEVDFEWVSSDPSVAEFEELHSAGIVPKKAGSVHFTVTSKANPDLKQELDFTFTYKTPLESVVAQPAHYDMTVGDLEFAQLRLNPENATQKQFVWTYDTEGIVSVENKIQIDEDGNAIVTYPITAIGAGEVVVTGTPVDDTANCIPVRFTVKVTGEEAPMPFTDVKESSWYYEDVKYMFDNGIMEGMSETVFGPHVVTNRAMVVTMLYRQEGCPAVSGKPSFTDLKPNEYYVDAIAWAEENHIVEGISETLFAPMAPITREQMAAILYRFADYKGLDVTADTDSLDRYSDVDRIHDYAVVPMAWAVEQGLIIGMTETTLVPRGDTERAQTAALFHRLMENIL